MVLFVGTLVTPSSILGPLSGAATRCWYGSIHQFVTDNLFVPGYDGLWDPLFTLILMAFLCHFAAVLLLDLGQVISHRLGLVGG